MIEGVVMLCSLYRASFGLDSGVFLCFGTVLCALYSALCYYYKYWIVDAGMELGISTLEKLDVRVLVFVFFFLLEGGK